MRFAEFVAVEVAGDAAAAQHDGAVADLDQFLGIGGDEKDGAALLGEFASRCG